MLWNKSYETGIPSVDEQHKELFKQVETLLNPANADRVRATFDFLGSYVIKHFGHEESLHAKSKYPKAAEHKKLHTDLIATYKTMKQEFAEKPGKENILALRVSRVLADWLKEHISGADKEFGKYYQSHQG